jgi:hypothetical protein
MGNQPNSNAKCNDPEHSTLDQTFDYANSRLDPGPLSFKFPKPAA